MKKLFISTLLLIAFDLLHAQNSEYFSIVGKVYGEEVRQVPPYDIITKPLINAYISFKELPKQGWLTDSTGCFRIENLKNETFHLKASYIGLNSCDTIITSYNEKETLCLSLSLWYDYIGEHQYSPELSRKNIKEGNPNLVIVIPEDKGKKKISDNPFFQKYGVHYVGYLEENGRLTSYLAVPNCILASYNQEVFDYLDSKYGKNWRHEAPKGIFGLDKTLDEPRDYTWHPIGFTYENGQNGKIVCLDNHGNKLFNVFKYDNGVDYVEEGLFRITDDNGLIGFADTLGNVIIKPQFKFAFPFANGTAKVTDKGEEKEVPGSNGEYHYWDSDDWYYIDRRNKIYQSQ